MPPPPKVVKGANSEPRREILAEAIVRIGNAAEELRKSGLNEEAIVTLLAHKTRISATTIKTVFAGLRQMRAWYCR